MRVVNVFASVFAAVLLVSCDSTRHSRRDDDIEREMDSYKSAPLPKGNVRVNVTSYRIEEDERFSLDWAFRYRNRNVTVEGGDVWESNGLVIFAGTDNFESALRVQLRNSRSTTKTDQFVVAYSGTTARFDVLQYNPTVVPIVIWGRQNYVLYNFHYTITGSSFETTPRIISDDEVEVELVPVISTLERGAVRVQELRTKVALRRGQPLVISSVDRRDESLGTTFFSIRSKRSRTRLLQVVRAEF